MKRTLALMLCDGKKSKRSSPLSPVSVLMTSALMASAVFTLQGQALPDSWSRASWPVIVNGDTLQNPWTGGLTAPQWSSIDADLDGDDDLFAFDRDGARLMMFERTEDPASPWRLRWDWTENWPELVDWCLLRDYNCDGKPDIFTSFQNGIRVYTNTTEVSTAPSFDPSPLTLSATFDFVGSEPSELPVICLGIDLPAILDHDDDGDLDIITFTETANTLYRFEGQTPCGLDLLCTNRCYGMLEEASENNVLFIGDDFECSFNVEDPGNTDTTTSDSSRTMLHTGAAITSLQLEEGGPKDLLISDVTYPEISGVVMETASNLLDSAVFVDPTFPANLHGDQALNLPKFPAAYHLDVDFDGVLDLLFSPNTPLETDDDASVHFFKNNGSNDAPLWSFVTDRHLQQDMMDFGRGAYPVLHDFDSDGLLDLAVANKERYEGPGDTPAAIAAYKNVGTTTNPAFEEVTMDWVPLSSFQIESPYPAFGDLDGDGDLDLLVGDELGRIHQFNNEAAPGEWPVYSLSALSIPEATTNVSIDVGLFAAPQLIDLDGDDVLEMVVGERNGVLTLFKQTPLGAWEKHTSPGNGEDLWGIAVDNLLGINGYSIPSFTQVDDNIRVLVANEIGTVQDFGVVPENWDATLNEVNNDLLGGALGFRAAAAFKDLNNDGLLDVFIGIQNGGLLAFLGASNAGCTDSQACNYDPSAAEDDGSCLQVDECGVCGGSGIQEEACDCEGNVIDAIGVCGGACMSDFNVNGVCDDSEVFGCAYPIAANYDPMVTDDDGSCIFTGCTDPSASNYEPHATVDDGTCQSELCEDGAPSNLGDLNNDGAVGSSDLLQFLAVFGVTYSN